jgi:hypothetical protein
VVISLGHGPTSPCPRNLKNQEGREVSSTVPKSGGRDLWPDTACRRTMSMPIERLIDELIEAGWSVLETDFDEKAFAHWRVSAHQCVAALLAPDNPCPELFQDHVTRKMGVAVK